VRRAILTAIAVGVLLLGALVWPKLEEGQTAVDGLIKARATDSIVIQGPDKDYTIKIVDQTVIGVKLFWPKIDEANKTVTLTMQISAPDGDPDHNEVTVYPLTPPRRLVGAGRDRKLIGLSIDDLKPYATDAYVIGRPSGDAIVADEISIRPVGDPLKREDPKLPRYLFIGDSISFNYNKALREALKGKVNLHHPPRNAGDSSAHCAFHRWLGAYKEPGRRWHVISFNFGNWDSNVCKEKYQANLEAAVQKLKATGAKIIWVTTCPVDYAYNHPDIPVNQGFKFKDKIEKREAKVLKGRVPGRMRLENKWAAEVMAKHPDVLICDQWQVVKNGADSVYAKWWYNKNVHFNYRESIPIARELARTVMKALGRQDEGINPMSVHGVKDLQEIYAKPKDKP